MKAHELATRLLENPEADVLIKVFDGVGVAPFTEGNISMNNEANAYIVFPPQGPQKQPKLVISR